VLGHGSACLAAPIAAALRSRPVGGQAQLAPWPAPICPRRSTNARRWWRCSTTSARRRCSTAPDWTMWEMADGRVGAW